METAGAVAAALATHLNWEPESYSVGDLPEDEDAGFDLGFGTMYDSLMIDPNTRRAHRFDTAIQTFETALFTLSHADGSEQATRNVKILLAANDADRHLEELDEAMGLFGY
jgi:hypothetical protein